MGGTRSRTSHQESTKRFRAGSSGYLFKIPEFEDHNCIENRHAQFGSVLAASWRINRIIAFDVGERNPNLGLRVVNMGSPVLLHARRISIFGGFVGVCWGIYVRVCSGIFGFVPNHSKTSYEKNCFSAWASKLNMGLINKVDMVCLSPVGYGV